MIQQRLHTSCMVLVAGLWLLAAPGRAAAERKAQGGVVEWIMENGKRHLREGREADARHEFTKALLLEPNHPEALSYLAMLDDPGRRNDQPVAVLGGAQPAAPAPAAAPPPMAARETLPTLQRAQEAPEVLTHSAAPYKGWMDQRRDAMDTAMRREAVRRSALRRRPPGPGRAASDDGPPPREATARLTVGATLIPAASQGFTTYTVAKPPEQIEAEEAVRRRIQEAGRTETPDPVGVPFEARPTVELQGHTTYSYSDPKGAPPFRTMTTTLRGHVGEFDMASESVRRDLRGTFQHDHTFLNFRSDDLFLGLYEQRTDLNPLRAQFQEFDGVKVQKIWGEPSGGQSARFASRYGVRALEATQDRLPVTTLAAGRMEVRTSGSEGQVKYLGDLYEARQQLLPWDWLALEGGALHLESDADLPSLSGTSAYPRDNLVSFASSDVRLPRDFRLSGQVARASYEPDHDPDEHIADWNWRSALAWHRNRSRAQVAYEFVGKDYASLGDPLTYQDYEGINAFGVHQLSDAWSVSSHFLRYRNNVDDDPDDTFSENQSAALSTSYRLTANQTVNLNFTGATSNPEGPNAGSSVKTTGYRADYFLPFIGRTRLLTSYQYLQNRVTVGDDLVSHSAGASLFGAFGRGSSWSLRQDARRTLNEDAPNRLTLTTTANLSHQVSPALSTHLSSSYARESVQQGEGTNVLSGAAGMRYQLVPETLVGSEFSIDSYDLDEEHGRFPRHWSLLFLVTQYFGITTQPNFGRLEGTVFQDANGNGRMDAGESGVEEAVIHLDPDQRRLTAAQGRYSFSRVLPGRHNVRLDLGHTDPDWMTPEARRQITVRRQRQERLDFALVRGGEIIGHVFIDANGDGVFQDTEEPLDSVAVVLQPGDEFRRSEADGVFQFEQLMPGAYTLAVHADDLPGGYSLVLAEPRAVTVTQGQATTGVDFPVRILAEQIQQF